MFTWFMQYKDTIGGNTALETTAETLARCICLFEDDNDKAFYATLFAIIFNFIYNDLDKQDETARKQILENGEALVIAKFLNICF